MNVAIAVPWHRGPDLEHPAPGAGAETVPRLRAGVARLEALSTKPPVASERGTDGFTSRAPPHIKAVEAASALHTSKRADYLRKQQ